MKKATLKGLVTGLMLATVMGAFTHAEASSTFTEYLSTYSATAPTVKLSRADSSDWTSKNVTFNVVVASPSGVGISHVVQPDGNIIASTSFQYTVSENGVYTFKAFGKDGKVGYNTVHVKGIDRKKPVIVYDVDGNWKNANQVVDIKIVND